MMRHIRHMCSELEILIIIIFPYWYKHINTVCILNNMRISQKAQKKQRKKNKKKMKEMQKKSFP